MMRWRARSRRTWRLRMSSGSSPSPCRVRRRCSDRRACWRRLSSSGCSRVTMTPPRPRVRASRRSSAPSSSARASLAWTWPTRMSTCVFFPADAKLIAAARRGLQQAQLGSYERQGCRSAAHRRRTLHRAAGDRGVVMARGRRQAQRRRPHLPRDRPLPLRARALVAQPVRVRSARAGAVLRSDRRRCPRLPRQRVDRRHGAEDACDPCARARARLRPRGRGYGPRGRLPGDDPDGHRRAGVFGAAGPRQGAGAPRGGAAVAGRRERVGSHGLEPLLRLDGCVRGKL